MPTYPGPSNSPFSTAASVPVVFATLTFGGAAALQTRELHADGLPALCAWFLTSLVGVVVQLEFADGNTAPGVVSWQPLVPPYLLAANVPNLVKHPLGSRRFRATVTAAGAGAVLYRLTAALT